MNQTIVRSTDYAQQVDRHLTSAAYLLNNLDALPSAPSFWQKLTLSESAALQLYFALRTYLNELISYYSKNFLPDDQVMLGELLTSASGNFQMVTEFGELRQLVLSSTHPWRSLCDLPVWLADTKQQKTLFSKPPKMASSAAQDGEVNVELITLNERSEKQELLDPSCIRSMRETLSELIERQRDNQVES